MRRLWIVLALVLVLGTSGLAQAGAPDTSGYRLVLDEGFTGLPLRSAAQPKGKWDTAFADGLRTLPSNGEAELYVDPGYMDLGLNPFSAGPGGLTITARPTPAELLGRLGDHAYVSGLLTSLHSFSMTYGYVELRARMPAGKGLWPAFWLLPVSRIWPPEIDVFEVLGDHPDILHMAVHSRAAGDVRFKAQVADLSKGEHDFGLLWGRSWIVWYLDGAEMARTPTPADMHQPMYLLLDLAVGGSWPGLPDAATHFPAEFKVARLRAYATPETVGE